MINSIGKSGFREEKEGHMYICQFKIFPIFRTGCATKPSPVEPCRW